VSVSESVLESISVESISSEALANLDLTDFSLDLPDPNDEGLAEGQFLAEVESYGRYAIAKKPMAKGAVLDF
jgi:hypothetical protein